MTPQLTRIFDDQFEAKMAETARGMPDFAGTGPTGAYCRECRNFTAGEKKFPCGKFRQLMKIKGSAIPGYCRARRYFEARSKRDGHE